MFRGLFALIAFLAAGLCAFAGDGEMADSTYGGYGYRYSVKFFTTDKFLSVLSEESSGKEQTFKSNRPLALGVGFYTGRMGMSISYGFDFLRNPAKGDTKSIDVQYTYFGRKFLADIVAQLYHGFYLDDSYDGSGYVIYGDMKVLRTGVSSLYAMNGENLSLKAFFENTERQVRSAGSFLIGGSAGYDMIFPGSSKVLDGNSGRGSFFIGPSAGYAYSWVLDAFHINVGISLNVDMRFGGGFRVTPSLTPRLGFAYDAGPWELFTSYKNYMSLSPYSGGLVTMSSGMIVLGAVGRFGDRSGAGLSARPGK